MPLFPLSCGREHGNTEEPSVPQQTEGPGRRESQIPKMRTGRGGSLGRGDHDFSLGRVEVEVPGRRLTGKIKKVLGSGSRGFKSRAEVRDGSQETSGYGER